MVVRPRPDIHNLVVPFAVGDQPGCVLILNLLHLLLGDIEDAVLLFGDHHVIDPEGDARVSRVVEAHVHELVGKDDRLLEAQLPVGGVDDRRHGALVHGPIDQVEAQSSRRDLRQQRAAHGRFHQPGSRLLVGIAIAVSLGHPDSDRRVQIHRIILIGAMHLLHPGEYHALAARIDALAGHVIKTKHDVLGGNDDRVAVGRRKYVVAGHHQRTRLQLRLQRQRHVDGHLVAVEVGVEGRTDQRMKLDRLALDQNRFERLDAETVQRRGTVEHDRMLADHLFEDVPDFRTLSLHQPLGGLDGRRLAAQLQLRENERLEKLQRQFLGQAALVQFQGRANDDDRPARIIDSLAQKILAEPALLALDHVGQGFERSLVGAGDRAAAPAVVEQRIHGLLQHPLFVAHDDVRRIQLQQPAQPVVAVDYAPVEVVEVAGGEPPTVQGHQRPQVRRQYGQNRQHHPRGLIAGIGEGFEQLQPL